jgi:hypothetical protein
MSWSGKSWYSQTSNSEKVNRIQQLQGPQDAIFLALGVEVGGKLALDTPVESLDATWQAW